MRFNITCTASPQPRKLGQQLFLRFGVRRIRVDAFDRAHHHALRLVEMADAFGAQRGIDHVDVRPLRDRLVRARRFADVAVDAEFVDLQRHAVHPPSSDPRPFSR
jgi:hypothetical protein